jgi:hypothetical protein
MVEWNMYCLRGYGYVNPCDPVHGLSTGILTVQLINLSTPTIVLSLDN